MTKKRLFSVGLILIAIFSLFVLGYLRVNRVNFETKNVLAEDDEHEEDEEDKEDEDEDDREEDREVEEKDVYETIIETSYQQVSTNVQKETVTKTLFDSDKDGIFDDEDEYPTINNFFIVKDDDRNGIVDKYDQ